MLWVDISLLVISIILMIREFFPKIEEYYKKRKKLVHIVLIVGMFALSITNIIQTNNENKDLITTAKTTLTKIDSVYQGQLNNYSSINQSVEEIKKVDSVLGGVKNSIQSQVKLLDSAIGKSQELIRLEQLDFESKKSELGLDNLKAINYRNDSTKIIIAGNYTNSGRKAIVKYSTMSYFITDKYGNKVKFLVDDRNQDANWTMIEVDPNKGSAFATAPISKNILQVENQQLGFVFSLVYQDYISKKIYKETFYQKMALPYTDKSLFSYQSPVEVELTNQILKKHQFFELIYPSKFYK